MGTNDYLLNDEFLAQLSQLQILQKKLRQHSDSGLFFSRKRGGNAEFIEHRPYQRGDEPRFIDWNLYQRHHQFFVKEFSKHEHSHSIIIFDASASMDYLNQSKGKKAAQIAAAISYLSLQLNDKVSLAWCNHSIHHSKVYQGKKGIIPILQLLNKIEYGGKANLIRLIHHYSQHSSQVNFYIFSDFYENNLLFKAISEIQSSKRKFILFQVLSQKELNYNDRGLFVLQDSETIDQEKIYIQKSTLKSYQDEMHKFMRQVETDAQKCHCPFFRLEAEKDFQSSIENLRKHHFFN